VVSLQGSGEGGEWRTALLLGLVVASQLSSCADAPPPTHVVLVSIDSLRADHLGVYGYGKDTSPRMDALAAEGTLVEHAISSTSWTLPAHSALFTGLADELHKVTDQGRALSPQLPTLAGRLAAAGFDTGAVVSGPFLHPRFGLASGFDDYLNCMGFLDEAFRPVRPMDLNTESHRDRTGACVVRRAGEWLRAHRDAPAFLFLHFWDVHYDYAPPPELAARFDPDYRGSLDASRFARNEAISPGMSPRDLEHLVALYDGEIAGTDAQLGQVLDLIGELGLARRTLVIVTSDHGDAFFEHGEKGHQKDLHTEVLRIPMLLRGPGVPAGLRLAGPAQITDLAPTVLDLLGLAPLAAEGPGSGRSLLPAFSDPDLLRDRQVHALLRASGSYAASLEGRTHKVIRSGPRRVDAYDIRQDPGEERPLVFPVEHARHLDEHLRALRRRASQFPEPEPLASPGRGVEQELRALGYLE
jgi:arylsulfatase A-like enzyme